jgi:hypothetical protein
MSRVFNAYQDLDWKRAGTLNLNIRFAQMSLALITNSLRPVPQTPRSSFTHWASQHFASAFFRGIDGDIRVANDTIVVTLYNAPKTDLLKNHYENLPKILERENVNPKIPWLFDYKLDFRFR